jgi:DNA-binding MarR family transcriptional regulator
MQRLTRLAARLETAAEALSAALDPARMQPPLPVSPTQLRVLTVMRARHGINVNGLAEALGVGASSASRLCDRLEALGYLRRTPHSNDRREVQLLLTPAALDVLDELSRNRRAALETVLARMSETARQELARSLDAFSAAANGATDLPGEQERSGRRTA